MVSTDRDLYSTDRDRSRADRNVDSTDRDLYSTDRDRPRADRNLASTERGLYRTDIDLPSTDRNLASTHIDLYSTDSNRPRADRNVASTDRDLYSTDRDLPSTDRNLTRTDIYLYGTHRDLPSADRNLTRTDRDLHSREKDLPSTDRNLTRTDRDLYGTQRDQMHNTEQPLMQKSGTIRKDFFLGQQGNTVSRIGHVVDNLSSTDRNMASTDRDLNQREHMHGPERSFEQISSTKRKELFLRQQGRTVSRTGQVVDSSGTRSESRDRIESQPDQLQQQLQPRFGMPPVHSTPRANANSTIDREIQNLDRHLERLSRDRDEAVIFEDTAKEREFKRLQEQSKLDTEPQFSRQQGAYDQSEGIKESVDHRTATSKRRVSFSPMTDIHVSDDQGVRPKIMSNLSRLKKDGEECLAANRGILGDASEKQVQSRSGLKLREKKESVDYRLPRLDEEFKRDQRPTVKQMSMEFADNGTAEKQCKLPDGGLIDMHQKVKIRILG